MVPPFAGSNPSAPVLNYAIVITLAIYYIYFIYIIYIYIIEVSRKKLGLTIV